ncbi:hypothetical protein A2961_03560 [Candidatus Woesebacteria bacterium RIFCSPLOWO2_01_FULL_39_21]|uniref:Prevent-host-death protein n=1 Tax=Candidatus Woesebacteria bacterium RIFCSPLOWO2_01_FULL_39_21 TaxID=1802519 RepID=A0A1F8BJF6_9BACT|nr:MAG: hypothetical protein A2691_01260 [Candidatus Woesebacteria bacterium RIFCSPHIGHO2_01_FULL_39_23]OGM64196.1 MAG: hypothetical protein A2961_03560 [Candidatus Woesebacteria bacterium RIFCSPLOWO2_01_FULL_39_21]
MNTKIIPITELRRRFGDITSDLHLVNSIILTKDGRPFAELRAVPSVKAEGLKKLFGAWKGTDLDSDKLWEEVFKRKSRRRPVRI